MFFIACFAAIFIACLGWAAIIAFQLSYIAAIVIYVSIVGIYKWYIDSTKMKEGNYQEYKSNQERIQKEAELRKNDSEFLKRQNVLVNAALNCIHDLRFKYPYADEYLFEEYRYKFQSYSEGQLKLLEEEIRKNHLNNEINYATNGKNNIQYSLNDLDSLNPIEEKIEKPLLMRIFKIDADYILYTKDLDNNQQYMVQSKDYLAILRMQNKVVEMQNKLKLQKEEMKAQQFNELFDSVQESTKDFRRNRCGFID